MAKPKPSPQTKICAAALRLTALQGWRSLTLEKIAAAAKVPLAPAKKLFATKNDILSAMVHWIDEQVAGAVGKPYSRATPQDRLFDVMMTRFEVLQKNRRAILGIMGAIQQDPSLARYLIPAQAKSMQKMLALAGMAGSLKSLKMMGLLSVYMISLCSWRRDDTADMAKTMAILDRNLRRAERLSEILFRLV